MSLLTPLYVLGALAVGLPVLFHLIQRRPRGEMAFSSLMFLSPSPPRLSRRSRLDNLLLLLLRVLALVLLAMAFARPFLRSSAWQDDVPPGRRVLLLADTSASMQRTGLWQQAQDQVREVLADLRPTDDVALYTFDSVVRRVVPFASEGDRTEISATAAINGALAEISPGNAATDLGRALTTAADVLHTSDDAADSQSPLPRQIVLITDLQSGSDLEELRAYTWPPEVRLEVRALATPGSTNARAVVLTDEPAAPGDAEGAAADKRWRVTVYNAADSVDQQFRIGWADHSGKSAGGREQSVQVPPGGSRTLRIELPPASAERLVLTGDEQPFDNAVFVARPTPRKMDILFVGNDQPEPQDSLLYYLSRAAFDDESRDVTVKSLPDGALPSPLAPVDVPLVVVAESLPIAAEEALRAYVHAGGSLLIVLRQSFAADAASEMLSRLVPGEDVQVREADVDDYAMLAQIDFSHAIFQPFADPRFNDFTKIQFWSHRSIELGAETSARALARFDDHSPALLEFPLQEGRIWVLAAGWQPVESEFALSSKFVPVLAGMLQSGGNSELQTTYEVGERLVLPEGHSYRHLIGPDGQVHDVTSTDSDRRADRAARRDTALQAVVFERPGIYRLTDGRGEVPLAVNLALAESRTAPLDVSELEALGAQTGEAATAAELAAERRRLRDFELESSQKLWQWLLVGALAVLCVESWLAGRLARRPVTAVAVPS